MHASLAARDFFYALQQNFCHMPTTATARSRCQGLLNIIDLSYSFTIMWLSNTKKTGLNTACAHPTYA